MSQTTYQLRIDARDPGAVSEILGMTSHGNEGGCLLDFVKLDKDPYYDYVAHFLDLLEGKYDALRSIGIGPSDISIWVLYEYDQQCNFELTPDAMARMGNAGVHFCFSAWEG